MSYTLLNLWRQATFRQRAFVVAAIFILALLLSGSFDACRAHRRDAAFDKREAERTERINKLEAEADGLRIEKAQLEARAAELQLRVSALDSIIEGAGERVKANDAKLEKLFADFEAEKSRLDSLSDDDVRAELARRLRAAGFKVE